MRRRDHEIRGPLLRLAADESGANAVEFALVVPFFIILLLGVYDFGRAVWTQGVLDFAVEQAARCAAIDTSTCDSASDTATYASNQTSPLAIPAADFTVTLATSCGASVTGSKVTASYNFSFLGTFPLNQGKSIFPTSVTLTSSSCYPG